MPRASTGSSEATVALLASPPGEGGVALIEVVGPAAEAEVARRFSRALPKPGRLAVGRLVDEVVIRVIPAGKSAYGEATVEISCHGGLQPAESVLRELSLPRIGRSALLDRAVAARRLDRIRAEALALLPEAATTLAARMLLDQARGALAKAVRRSMKGLLATAPWGIALTQPRRVAIVGRANAGKSTLFNALVGRERTLVSPAAGTTRDPVEELVAVDRIPLRLVDTAGLLPASAPAGILDQLAWKRSREEIARADLLLWVRDATRADSVEERLFRAHAAGRPVLEIFNKVDLTQGFRSRRLAVSAVTQLGLERLRSALVRGLALPRRPAGSPVVFTERQRVLLEAFEAGAGAEGVREKLLWA